MSTVAASPEETRELIADFVDEAQGSLSGLPAQLESHRNNPESGDGINAVFRAVHSIKGCAGFLGLPAIKSFSHALENTLDEVRQQRLDLTVELQRSLVLGFDYLGELLVAALEGTLGEELGPRELELLDRIAELCSEAPRADEDAEESLLAAVLSLAAEMAVSDTPGAQVWVERLREAAAAVQAVQSGATELPEAETPKELEAAPTAANAQEPSTAECAPRAAAEPATSAGKTRLVRVKEERLDEFLEQVSGLFITGELLKDLHSRMRASKQIASLVEEMRQINRSFATQATHLQQSLVALRRVAVSGLFSKFPRMARGLADQLGKKLDVHVSGEDVEIDKNLIEELDSPLTHMIRNVVDHAIETPEERLRRGVGEVGNLWLHAEQTRSHIHIIVRDDGRGIDPERMRRKSVEKGMITQAQANALSDQDAIELIFAAGFSTAEKLSDISGRGVGMDVVRTTVREQNGEVQVSSQVNVGTTFTIGIPIRTGVLVVDGLLVETSGEKFVLPFEHLLEITHLNAEGLTDVHGSLVCRIRGNTYGTLHLADVLRLPRCEDSAGEPLHAVLVGCKYGQLCLLVDRVLGHRQVVVNNVQEVLPCSSQLAGVAQLGGGRLALLLSVPEIVRGLQVKGR